MAALSASAQRVQDELRQQGYALSVIEMPQTTRSAREAAQAIGCRVEQIAKSLVFRGAQTGRAFLVIASGSNRVNEGLLEGVWGEPVEKPDADFVLAQTGYSIGGVPPLGHRRALPTYIDQDLLQYAEIWAAAGTPFAVFRLTPQELVQMTGGSVLAIH